MNKRFALTLLACLAVLVGIFWFVQDEAGAPEGDGQVSATNHVMGEGTGGVTLTEYGDFQCLDCAAYYPVIEQVQAKYGDRIKFQFRHFPLTQINPNAMTAHRAAEAAGQQDKFWEMYDLLYQNQQTWKDSSNASDVFEDYAEQLRLDIDSYKEDFASAETNRRINADIKEGNTAKVSSTPTFLLNGEKLEEAPRDLEGFSKLIDAALQDTGTE